MIDERVMRIADGALAGKLPTRDDVMHLLKFDAYSVEAAYVCARARELGMRACKGRGFVYAQIGVDENPCPENCRFCSFAASNYQASEDGEKASFEVPIGRIVHYAKLFDAEGVDLVSLMATAALDFDRYLDMIRAVKSTVSDRLVIMANTGDLTRSQALALREAGATAAYHAVRLGEGELTDIKPIDRRRTIRYLHAAEIDVMTGVEPLWEDADSLMLSERICDIPEFEPFCMGSCSYTPTPGDGMGDRKPAKTGFLRYVAAITRLVCGDAVRVGGIGGVAWVDAGCDPRKRGYGADDDALRREIAGVRKRLVQDGFTME